MESTLLKFVNTLDQSLKRLHQEGGDSSGFALLTVSQLHYIGAINDLDEVTVTALARNLGVSKPSVTAGINKLMRMGYVTKTPSPRDRRSSTISLTPAGERLVQDRARTLQRYSEFILATLTPVEARQFETLLKKLVQRFD